MTTGQGPAEGFADVLAQISAFARPLAPGPEVLDRFFQRLRRLPVAKGQHLCREGDRAETLYFVASGTLRYYYLVDGTEHTGQFFTAGMFCADVAALTTGAPALQNFDVLAKGEVVAIPKGALEQAYDADHGFERFGRRIMEAVMAGSQRRSANLLMLSPEDRYAAFAKARPEVLKSVPQYIIASYLGITPESLSRIRARRVRE